MNLATTAVLMIVCKVALLHGADSAPQGSSPVDDSAIPQPLKEEVFEALVTNPPFTRSLGVSDSMILTGIAHIQDNVFATLLDTKTMESHLVSNTANQRGWQLVGVGGNADDLQTLTARIQIAGGQVISVRYQKPPPPKPALSSSSKSGARSSSGSSGGKSPPLSTAQLDEAKNAAVNYRAGFNADGYPNEPPPEMVAKLSRLSTSQREEINRTMFGHRNQGLGMEERRRIYEGMVERAMQQR